jgi:hypothetical protein
VIEREGFGGVCGAVGDIQRQRQVGLGRSQGMPARRSDGSAIAEFGLQGAHQREISRGQRTQGGHAQQPSQ